MQVVDPHIHLWDTRQVSYPWLEQASVVYSGDNRLLPQHYDVNAFLQRAAGVDVRMSVAVEANPADPLDEVRWLQAQADDPANGGHPHGIVASAQLSHSNAPDLLERLSQFRNVRGIRQILNVHAERRYDYVGRQFMLEPQWRQNLRCLGQYGWSFDLQIYPAQVPATLHVLDNNVNIVFIVNHTGMFVDRDSVRGWREWRTGLRDLASRDNTCLKLSGLAMFDHAWSVESLRPYVLAAIDAFGTERCMFASNFPVDGLHATYAALWSAYAEIVSGASEQERIQLFGANAARYYRLHR